MTGTDRLPIRYRGFYDIPRMVVVRVGGSTYLLDCPFDADRDEFPDCFDVYVLPDESESLLASPSWESCLRMADVWVGCRSGPLSSIRADDKASDPPSCRTSSRGRRYLWRSRLGWRVLTGPGRPLEAGPRNFTARMTA